MKSFNRIILMLVVLIITMLSITPPSRADEPNQAGPKIFLPLIIKAQSSLVNGNFESGNTGWAVSSTHNLTVITQSFAPNSATVHGGSWGAWLGGQNSELTSLQQEITIAANSPYLAYWHWIGSNDICGYDKATILINNTSIHEHNLCSTTNTNGWVKQVVNLSSYAGQTVTLRLQAQNDSSFNSNFFLDDVAFQGAATLTSNEIAEMERNTVKRAGTETDGNNYDWLKP